MNQPVTPENLGHISVPALQQYLRSAEACGLSREKMLAEAGIPAEVLLDNNSRLPGDVLQRLLSYVLPRCGNPLFGLQTSYYIQPGSYSVVGYIAMTSNTLAEAVSRVPQYEKLVGDMGTSVIEHEPGAIVVRWNCRFSDVQVRRHIIENVLASWTSYSRWMADAQDLSPLAVRFEHEPPADRTLLKQYQQIFRCPVYFNQPMSAIVISPQIFEFPLRQPDVNLRETLEQHAQVSLAALKEKYSLSDQVRSLLRAMLADSSPRKEFVAEQMGMNVRTLHRKLADEETSYQLILDDLRAELARKYLQQSALSVEEIARRLGFTESRSFIRYFKGYTGTTPGEFRQSTREEKTA
ncbi:MAG: AraC family transcriptional regulator [Moraxellaceae bacterium]|nr:AraC family transcriptional regulator [Moraxellaceae bacterium]